LPGLLSSKWADEGWAGEGWAGEGWAGEGWPTRLLQWRWSLSARGLSAGSCVPTGVIELPRVRGHDVCVVLRVLQATTWPASGLAELSRNRANWKPW
jgi:hypothetical protein